MSDLGVPEEPGADAGADQGEQQQSTTPQAPAPVEGQTEAPTAAPAPGDLYQAPPPGAYAPPPPGAYPAPPPGAYLAPQAPPAPPAAGYLPAPAPGSAAPAGVYPPPPVGAYPPAPAAYAAGAYASGGQASGATYPPSSPGRPGGPYPPHVGPARSRGMAVTALVLGIVALVFFWVPFFGVLTGLAGVAAVVLGSLALARHLGGRGMSLAGLITGAIGVVLTLVLTIVWVGTFAQLGRELSSLPSHTSTFTPGDGDSDGNDSGGESTEFHRTKQSGPVPFAQAVTYDNGVKVTLSPGTAYTPEDPVWATQAADLGYEVTVENTTSKKIVIDIVGDAAAAGVDGDEILDQGLDTLKEIALAPGATGKYRIAFSLASATDVSVNVSIAEDYDYAQFAG